MNDPFLYSILLIDESGNNLWKYSYDSKPKSYINTPKNVRGLWVELPI